MSIAFVLLECLDQKSVQAAPGMTTNVCWNCLCPPNQCLCALTIQPLKDLELQLFDYNWKSCNYRGQFWDWVCFLYIEKSVFFIYLFF